MPDESPLAVTVRPMTPADIPQVEPIERVAFPELHHATPFHAELESRLARYLVATHVLPSGDEAVVGYAGLWFVLDEAHVTSLGVRPDMRRRGIARQLMFAVYALALERECILITLEVRASNAAAQQLYQTLGFRKVGVRRGYYSDNREDAWLMTIAGIETSEVRERLDALRAIYAPHLPKFPLEVADAG